MCGIGVTSSAVSQVIRKMNEKLEQWYNSPLGETAYLYLNARYEKVRQDGYIRDAAVLIAVGVGTGGSWACPSRWEDRKSTPYRVLRDDTLFSKVRTSMLAWGEAGS